jgi:hypothetical protein
VLVVEVEAAPHLVAPEVREVVEQGQIPLQHLAPQILEVEEVQPTQEHTETAGPALLLFVT